MIDDFYKISIDFYILCTQFLTANNSCGLTRVRILTKINKIFKKLNFFFKSLIFFYKTVDGQFAMSPGSYDPNLGSEILILGGDIRSRSWPNIGDSYGK